MYILTGENDTSIIPDRQDAEVMFYSNFGANIEHSVKDMGHVWATDVVPGGRAPDTEDCQAPKYDGISNCGIDIAGEMLTHLLTNLPDGPD